MIIKHTEEFDLAYRFVTETSRNIFLTGNAGTGKTTFLKYLQKNSSKKIVVAAPTGVAAINARGVTLHSLFQLPFGIIVPDSQPSQISDGITKNHSLLSRIHYNKEKLNLLRNIELMIIDEASMLPSYILDAIDTILKNVRRNYTQPFGGVQILFIGDLYQLPPVIKREDWEILQNYYSSVFFFDSFVLRDNIPVLIEFKEIFRQKDDKFIEILNGIRNNNITEENFNILKSRIKNNFITPHNDEYIILTTHNYQSEEINRRKLNTLSARTFNFQSQVNGEFPENIFPAEKDLTLKTGAQVMFLKNDTEGKQYFNGKIGTIIKLDKDTIKVKCKDDPYEIEVKKYEWQNIRYKMNPDTREINEEVLGSFVQYPLRLAWAITIHKSQGLTFDRVIVDAEKAFTTGQVYVALSRCTSLEGLILSSPVNRNFLGAHRDLKEWQVRFRDTDIRQLFENSRQDYILQELLNIFSWEDWYYELKRLNEALQENNIPAESIQWLTGLMNKQKILYEISGKFKQEIFRLQNGNSDIEKNDFLQKRIKDGAKYFFTEIGRWREEFINHPLSVKTKKTARIIDKSLEELEILLREILQRINYCRDGFLFESYLQIKKSLQANTTEIRSSYGGGKNSSRSLKDIPNPQLYRDLVALRGVLAIEANFPEYGIFSDKAIKNICINLPSNKGELRKVKGFGKAETYIYGDKILSVVKKYCRNNNIDISEKRNDLITVTPINTVEETIKYFREGKKIEQIALERNLVISTIENHIAQAVRQNLIQIEEVMDIEEAKKISGYFPKDLKDIRLAAVKETAPPEITYGKLRIVLAWLERRKQ